MTSERLRTAIKQLQAGRPIVLRDSPDRENEGDLAFAAKDCTVELVNLALIEARGLLCIALSPDDASRIGVELLPSNHLDRFNTPFGMPIDVANGTSGVSSSTRAETIRTAASPTSKPGQFVMPGHIATLIANARGLAGRTGHTEAILALLNLAGVGGPGVLCEILDANGNLASRQELMHFAEKHTLPILDIHDLL